MSATRAADPIETDVLVVGAGPVGLYQVFQLGLHELRSQLIDSLPMLGGQCIELYPDKPLYDVPGLPACTGRELIDRLVQQMRPFATPPHLAQEVEAVEPREDGRFRIRSAAGTVFDARAVIVAGGIGSFQPRRLKIDSLGAYERTQVHYGIDDPLRLAGQRVVIVGDGDAALDAAIALAEDPRAAAGSVTLMHRVDEFKADARTVGRWRALRDAGRARFVAAQPVGFESDAAGRLATLRAATIDDTTVALDVDALLVCTGLSPRLGPLAQWGLNLERKQIVVDTERFESSVPGIYAVGDIAAYPGKRKLIVSGFHEATLAAFAAAARVHPDRPQHLEYTTTSPRLKRLLGVEDPRAA